MLAADLTALQNRIVSKVPLCPAAFATAYIRQAAYQFFRDAEVWRYTFEDVDVVANQAKYKLSMPTELATGVEITRLDYVLQGGALVTEGTYDLDYLADGDTYYYYLYFHEDYVPTESITISNYAAWSALTTYVVDSVCKYNRLYWKSLLVANLNKNPVTETTYWTVDEPEKGFEIYAVLNPSIVSGYITKRLWLQWSDAIMWGAILAMSSSRNRPWYDPVMQMTAGGEYGTWLALARKERTQQFGYDGELRATNAGGWL